MIGNLPETLFLRLGKNTPLLAKRSWGFHPRRCDSTDATNPEQVLRHHRSAQGRYGGQALTSIIVPLLCISYQKQKEFSRAVSPSVFNYRGRGNQRIAGAALFADSPPVSSERVVPWKRDHTWRRYPDIKEIHPGSSRGIATRKTGKSFYRV